MAFEPVRQSDPDVSHQAHCPIAGAMARDGIKALKPFQTICIPALNLEWSRRRASAPRSGDADVPETRAERFDLVEKIEYERRT